MPQARARSVRSAKGSGKPAGPRRGGAPTALADSLRKVTRRALGQRSLAERSLILDWPSIAGDDIAGMGTPKGISFPQRDRRVDGTLTLTVRSGQATRLQHLEPQLIERINGYLGYRAVARVRLVHGARPASGGQDAPPSSPGRPAAAPKEPSGEAISDPVLRAALVRLGQAVKTQS